jgi:putative ABC transport system permease protein
MTATALKIAIREAHASSAKFFFVIFAVAIGVGALTGVRGFSEAFRSMLLKEARTLMAADVSVRIFSEPSQKQQAALERLVAQGIRLTQVTETLSMVSSASVSDPVLVSLKAVDPSRFPFYGQLTIDPAGSISQRLTASAALISDDLQLRLNARPGDLLRIGDEEFRVAGIVIAEPDRMSGSFNVGPRVMITREGLDRTGLMRLGSRASQRFLFALPQGVDVERVRTELRRAFPEALIVDFREINPNISRGLNRATTFLSLISLIALIIGAIGVATSMHAHLQQKMDSIAVMKSIGARSNQVVRIYLLQTSLLGIAGGLLGVLIGVAVQRVFPIFVQRYFHITPDVYWTPVAAIQGFLIGLLVTLLFTAPPLLSVRRIPPAIILRRDMADVAPDWRLRLRNSIPSIVAGFLICLGLAGIAIWLTGGSLRSSVRVGVTFVAALICSLVVLALVAEVLLRGLRVLVVRGRWRLPVMLRHAVANLYRPGSQSRPVLSALGVGVMFTLTVYLLQHSVLDEIRESAPPGMANVFFLDIRPEQRDAITALITKHPGVERNPEVISTVSGKIDSVDGVPIGELGLRGGAARRFQMARAISTEGAKPEGIKVVRGNWWSQESSGEPQMSVSEGAARNLKVSPGSTITWNIFGRMVKARVAAVHDIEGQTLRAMIDFFISPGALEGLPTSYYAAARATTPAIASLQRASFSRFPTVTVINIAEILDRIQEVVDQIAVVVRFISAFSILAGAVILASSVAGTRFRRTREVVIFKTLGATRSSIVRMFSAEFLILGAVAGLMGSLLAAAFSAVLLDQFFDAEFRFEPLATLVAIVLSSGIAAASGWIASFRILGHKPLEILRAE